jgi:hypothetical protein
MRRVGKSVRRSSKSEGERCPPFRMRLPMDGGHGARAPFAHPTQPISNSIICRRSFAISPHVLREFDPDRSALGDQRAQGMPGADAPAAARGVVNTRVSHHGHTGNTRHSPRNGFNSLYRALPGDRALLPPSLLRSLLLKNLAPASGRQDHTILPSASAPPVLRRHCVHRSPLHVRDVRETPLWGSGIARTLRLIWVSEKAKYFWRGGWTGFCARE